MAQNTGFSEVARKIVELRRLSRGSALVGFAMLFLVGLISVWSLSQMDATGYWVSHTYQVISSTNKLLSDLKDAEAAARAFLLQPIPRYQTEFDSAASRVPDDLSKLKSLTSDNRSQQARLFQLTPILSHRMEQLEHVVSVRASSGFSDSERAREEEETKHDSDPISQICQQLQNEEYRLLEERQHARRVRLTEGFIGTLGSLILALAALMVSSQLVRRAIRDLIESDRRRQEHETMATSLFEAAPESILVVDETGIIRKANPETEHLFGYSPDEICDLRVASLLPGSLPGDDDALRKGFFFDPLTRSAVRKFETSLLRNDGSEFIAEVSIVHIQTGNDSFAVAFISDVTKRHSDEQAIRDYAGELQQLAGKLMTAQEDERRRIARDLHDDLNQKLAYLSMDLARLVKREQTNGIGVELNSLHRRAAEAADFVRSLSHQLHPAVLEDLGLESALEDFCQEFQDRSGIQTSLECNDLHERIKPQLASCVYHVVAECLRNVAKHARAASVCVRLGTEASILRVDVIDDGIGFTEQRGKTSGIGIVAMRERLHLLKGNIDLQSAEPHGTRVSVTVPL